MVHTLLEAGVPLLLRYSLDEQNEAVIGATVDCLHAILVSPLEEVNDASHVKLKFDALLGGWGLPTVATA